MVVHACATSGAIIHERQGVICGQRNCSLGCIKLHEMCRTSRKKESAFIRAHARNFFAHLIKHAHLGVANRGLGHL